MKYRVYEALEGTPHVVVDGSAQSGTALALSHWPGSETPDALRRDLSAEIAFAYLDHPELHIDVEWVTNNHFDQDGLVSVFALTEPDAAVARRERLIDIARAGDFSCFHDRDSARAAITIANLGDAADGDPYPELLARLTEIVDHVDRFRDLWIDEDAHVTETETAIADGTITIEEHGDIDLAIVTVPPTWEHRVVHRFTTTDGGAAHPFAVHNATDRLVVLTRSAGPPELRFRYETWVHYMSRRPRPRVDVTELAAELTAAETGQGRWSFDGLRGLSPALHLVRGETIIDPARFQARVVEELRASRSTWNPYDAT